MSGFKYSKKLENDLKSIYNKKYCILTGNATTAIYIALFQNKKVKSVGISNNICFNVPMAARLAKKKIVFIDNNKLHLGVDLKDLKNQKIDCLIAHHVNGNDCNINEIKKYTKKNNVLLIEDCASSFGLKYNGSSRVKSYGDIVIVSFGKGKIIDVGHGGALLTNCELTHELSKKTLNKLNNFEKSFVQNCNYLSQYHTRIYNKVYLYNEKKKNFFQNFVNLIDKKGKFFLYKFHINYAKKILLKIKHLNRTKKIRLDNYIFFEKKLKSSKFETRQKLKNNIPWRFNLFFKSKNLRNKILINLLKKKIKVSSWYTENDTFFLNKCKNKRNSQYITNKILNIWIDETCSDSYKNKILKTINSFI